MSTVDWIRGKIVIILYGTIYVCTVQSLLVEYTCKCGACTRQVKIELYHSYVCPCKCL